MHLETDLKKIREIALRNEEKNMRFRLFLKESDYSSKEIDEVVHRINDEVTAQIDCRECGNCCMKITPILDERDIDRLAKRLEIDKDSLIRKYLKKDKDRDLVFNSKPCPFLDGKSCSVYSSRPEACRSYPHLHKKDFNYRTLGILANTAICPIVFNVFERVKLELWRRPSHPDFHDI